MNDKATLQKFKKIFESTQLDKIKPIDWQKSIASLRYFIKQFPFENKTGFPMLAQKPIFVNYIVNTNI